MDSLVVRHVALLTVFVLMSWSYKESEAVYIGGPKLIEIRGTCWIGSKCDNCIQKVGNISNVKVCCSECRNAGFIISGSGKYSCSCRGDSETAPTFVYPSSTACDFKGTWLTWAAILIASSFAALATGRMI